MIIEYKDGTRVELHLGDLSECVCEPDMAWFKLADTWIRSPFDTANTTKRYLLSLHSAAEVDLLNIPQEFKDFLRG